MAHGTIAYLLRELDGYQASEQFGKAVEQTFGDRILPVDTQTTDIWVKMNVTEI